MVDVVQRAIDQLYIVISLHDPEKEMLVAAGEFSSPMIAADHSHLEKIIRDAKTVAKQTGHRVKVIRLSNREELADINP